MRRPMVVLLTNEQIQNCIQSEVEVEVWFQDELNLVSRIISFDKLAVRFSEGNYLKRNVMLKTSGNYFKVI